MDILDINLLSESTDPRFAALYKKVPKTHLYDTSLTVGGNRIYLLYIRKTPVNKWYLEDVEEDDCVELDWNDKGIKSKIRSLYKQATDRIKSEINEEISSLNTLKKLF